MISAMIQPSAMPDDLGAAASDYLNIFGYVALGHQWLRTARVAHERLSSGGAFPSAYYEAKVLTARFYFQRLLPTTLSLYASMTAGSDVIMQFPAESF